MVLEITSIKLFSLGQTGGVSMATFERIIFFIFQLLLEFAYIPWLVVPSQPRQLLCISDPLSPMLSIYIGNYSLTLKQILFSGIFFPSPARITMNLSDKQCLTMALVTCPSHYPGRKQSSHLSCAGSLSIDCQKSHLSKGLLFADDCSLHFWGMFLLLLFSFPPLHC